MGDAHASCLLGKPFRFRDSLYLSQSPLSKSNTVSSWSNSVKTSLIDAMKKVVPYSFLFNICLSFVHKRYIEAVRKLRSQGVTLRRTVHMTFVPGNFWIKVSVEHYFFKVSCMEQCLSPWMVWWGEGWTGYTQDFDEIYMLARGF